jgi:hypothetical protein
MSKPRKRGVEVGDLITGIEQAPLAGAPSPKVSMGLRDASPLRSPPCRLELPAAVFAGLPSGASLSHEVVLTDRGLASAGMRD